MDTVLPVTLINCVIYQLAKTLSILSKL